MSARRPVRVLAVDDQPASLLLLRKVLGAAGIEVSEARSGAEALAVAQETAPDLILLDMHMPDMHGLDVLRRLRETTWGVGLAAVAMSALAGPEDRAAWLQAGFVGTIEKPIDINTFVSEIAQWLPRRGRGKKEARNGEVRTEERFRDRLGEILVANLLITPEQLSAAVQTQVKTGKRLGQVLVEQGALSEDDIAWALSNQLGYPYVFLTPEIMDVDAVRLLPPTFLQERRILPILKFGQEMTLAMADPTDQRTLDDVVERTGLRVKRALALASNIEEMQNHFFTARGPGSRPAAASPAATEAQYLQFHLVQALQQGASEIHFDPSTGGQARVRYRLHGMLLDRPGQPADLHVAILRHLRNLAGAADGPMASASTSLAVGDEEIWLVATFMPTAAGEAATLLLFPRSTDTPELEGLGVSETSVAPLRAALDATSGVIMVGCGDRWLRSALLHALIPARTRGKIWSLETLPVFHRPTLNQTVLGGPADAAAFLRAVADGAADLVVLDDATDPEGLRAAFEIGRTRLMLAGHPQGDLIGLLSEALDVVGSALVASTIRGILAARAVRLLCPVCKQPAPDRPDGLRTFVPAGCEACGFTGFRGRRLLADVWTADARPRRMIRARETVGLYEAILRTHARMREQGLGLVEDGLTSMEELTSVIEGELWRLPTSSS